MQLIILVGLGSWIQGLIVIYVIHLPRRRPHFEKYPQCTHSESMKHSQSTLQNKWPIDKVRLLLTMCANFNATEDTVVHNASFHVR
jgi:hypothetical protein